MIKKTIIADDQITRMSFVPEKGGTAYSLVMPGREGERELLYVHDNFWQDDYDDLIGGWPFCFPVCARLARDGEQGVYLYQGQRYHMNIHGVSWDRPWQVVDEAPSRLVLQLTADEQTKAAYPFDFRVTLDYRISPGELLCLQHYENLSDQPMPYYAGFHPYFLTPAVGQGKQEVSIHFDSDYRLQYNEHLTDIVGRQAPIHWPASAANPEINEQLSHVIDENEFSVHYPGGDVLTMQCFSETVAQQFPFIQTYTMVDKPFICVEPWMSHPNALNTLGACRWLSPGSSDHATMKLFTDLSEL